MMNKTVKKSRAFLDKKKSIKFSVSSSGSLYVKNEDFYTNEHTKNFFNSLSKYSNCLS